MRYAVAAGSMVVAWLAREALTPMVGPAALPFIFFFPAITLAAWYGGFGPAAAALAFSGLAAEWSFFEPFRAFAFTDPLALIVFALVGLFIIAAIQAMHRAIEPRVKRKPTAASGAPQGLLRVFVVMSIVVVGSVILTYWFGWRVTQLRDRAAPHRNVIAELERLLSTVKDAETGQRGYLITSEERYLAPYDATRARLPEEIAKLRSMAKITLSPGELDAIESLARAKLDELERTITVRRLSGFDTAAAVIRAGEGKDVMDRLRQRIARLRDEQEAELREETKLANEATHVRTTAVVAVGFLNLLFLVWAYERIVAALRERQAALAETEQQKNLLSVTLASIGDCVIVTDKAARITFMNPVAENLTGWKFDEAKMRPASDVFKIINEFSREPVESPVEKVMKHGVIVGLANHTVLIRRDGSEVPIDDSGAPIRDLDGTVRGAVLVFRDFSEHKEVAQKLKEAKEIAETANKAKDQFLAMLSHELRTPLTPVLATLNLWEASEDLPHSMLTDVRMLRRSIELEARIIDDLLDLTRVARGLLSFSDEDSDVHELIQFLAEMCRSEVQGRELKLSMHLDAKRHHVHTDAARFKQVLWNILKNAVKFTDTGGSISVSTSNDNAWNIIITVTDTGMGMTRDTIARLFTPFEQGDELVGRRYGGLGLGLAISSALVELMGGKIAAESAGLGKGSTFIVTFPAMKEAPAAATPLLGESQKKRAGGIKILLVEDHADTARALVRLLERHGHEVRIEGSVKAALAAVRNEPFDLFICDIGLPDGTGFDLMKEVRKTCRTPALALSGFAMQEDVARAKLAGFDGHLAKPVNFQKLEAAIWQLTADYKPAREVVEM